MRVLALLWMLLFFAVAPLRAQDSEPDPRAGDEHSYAEPEKVVVRELGLDLRIDFARKQIRGTADLALAWKDPKYKQINLDTRDLSIDRVIGRRSDSGWFRLAWSLGTRDAILGQKLSITAKQPYDVVRIRYRSDPKASGLQWLEASMTAGKKMPFMFSQSQAIHARSWVPLQDTPSVRYTYSAHVETHPGMMVLMSGDNQPDQVRDGDYVFRQTRPIPSYLMAIAAGDLEFRAISARSGVWAEPATIDSASLEFSDTERMIQIAEKLYGPYRWERYDLLILPPSFPFGGMENPRVSFITPTVITGDKTLVSLIAHELAHSWSGNLVTNSSWKDIWLNEGFTSYVENRIVEALYGAEQAQMEDVIDETGLRAELADLKPEQQLLVLANQKGKDPDESLTHVAYIKGRWFLKFLEQRFGRERFDPFLRGWFDSHAFQSVDSATFEAYLRSVLLVQDEKAVSEAELTAWLREPGIPKFAEAARSERLERIDTARAQWLEGSIAISEIEHQGWITQEWVHFLEGMPESLEGTQLVALDNAFHFTGTQNGEIAQRWYPLTVRSGYFEARPAIADFLARIGRRKLILPTYEELAKSTEGRKFASQVFEKARPGYHPITVASVEAILAKPLAD